MKRSISLLFVLLSVFVVTNLSFIGFHYISDQLVDRELIETRLRNAFQSGHFYSEQYPFKSFGTYSEKNLHGIDQYSECVNALMALHRNPDTPLLNAIIPGYPSFEEEQYCLSLKMLVIDGVDPDGATINTKARLWFGTRPVTVLMLSKFEIAQLYPFIKQLSYFGFGLLLAIAFSHSAQLGLMVLPFSMVGIFGSGIPYYGGVANAMPFAAALYLGVGMALLRRLDRGSLVMPYAVAAGSILAFFYLTDGSLILALSIITFSTYFFAHPRRAAMARWRDTLSAVVLFTASFVMSLVFKQLIAGLVTDLSTVWDQFVGMVGYRLSTEGGPDWNHWQSFYGQLETYDLAVLWNPFLYKTVLVMGATGWIVALGLFILIIAWRRKLDDVCALSIYLSIALIVFMRYFLMVNHSFEHWFIVSRYTFVLLAAGMSAAIYTVHRLIRLSK